MFFSQKIWLLQLSQEFFALEMLSSPSFGEDYHLENKYSVSTSAEGKKGKSQL